ncbi:MAG TPA: PqqD family peptide modification chaperone [Chloroflexota bacterium]|nr:PqqD family peptide modification chaperone [Chloroflexota bacterium]
MTNQTDLSTHKPVCFERTIINADISGAITVLNPVTGRVFVVNDVGRRILELADGSRTLGSIVDTILSEFHGSERASTERDVGDFLRGCEDAQIINWCDGAV